MATDLENGLRSSGLMAIDSGRIIIDEIRDCKHLSLHVERIGVAER